MKAKARRFEIAGHEFQWRVVPHSKDYVCLCIWAVADRRTPWTQLRYRFDDPWLLFGDREDTDPSSRQSDTPARTPIQPRLVREIIERVAADRGRPSQPVECRYYELDGHDLKEVPGPSGSRPSGT